MAFEALKFAGADAPSVSLSATGLPNSTFFFSGSAGAAHYQYVASSRLCGGGSEPRFGEAHYRRFAHFE